jgi:hypothetical protein
MFHLTGLSVIVAAKEEKIALPRRLAEVNECETFTSKY